MKRLIALAILVLCSALFAQPPKATICFVHNGGAGAHADNGGATWVAWDAGTPDDFIGDLATGSAVKTDTGCSIASDGGGSPKVRITAAAGTWADVVDGTVAWVDFDATAEAAGYVDAYTEVTRVGGDNTKLDLINIAYISATGTCDVRVGGAIDTVGNASAQDIMNAVAYARTCYVRGNVAAATASVSITTGGGTVGVSWKSFVGVNASWVNDGTRVVYDATGTDFAGTPIFRITDLSWVRMENFTAQDNDGNGGTPASGEDGFQHYSDATADTGIAFINCSVSNCFRGFNMDGSTDNRVSVVYLFRCDVSGCVDSTVYGNGGYTMLERCQLTTTQAVVNVRLYSYLGGSIEGCRISGGTYGVQADTTGNYGRLAGNTFYNQTTACVGLAAARTADLTILNNLFWVATIASDYAVQEIGTAAILLAFEDYNFTNATNPIYRNDLAQGWEGSHSQAGLWTDTEANLWVDAAGGNFTPVDMIDDGMPTLNAGKSTPGAVWLTQIQTGGGGFPVTSTIGGHIQH